MVSIVVVSHIPALAEAARELAAAMGTGEVRIEVAGGGEDGVMGANAKGVEEAIERAEDGDGVVLLGDLGSAIIAIKTALAAHEGDDVRLADAPLVEGLVAAAVTASAGGTVDEVVRSAEHARQALKT